MADKMIMRLIRFSKHFSGLCRTDCTVYDLDSKTLHGAMFCHNCRHCDFENTHKYGCFEAQRWGGRYIYYCPAGLTFVAAVLCENSGKLDAGLLAGPMLMGEREDFIEKFPLPYAEIPQVEPLAVNDIAEVMAAGLPGGLSGVQYDALLNDMYAARDAQDDYPIGMESQLCDAIEAGDATQARELLNLLLGHIFFGAQGDFSAIKTRVTELMIIISRSAIRGGADIHQIFIINKDYMEEIRAMESLEKLSLWLTGVLDRFMSYVFEFSAVKHSDVVYKIIGFVQRNYMHKITLDDIAAHVYLSRSYVSKIFKEEMECSLTAYINQVRVQKSKVLLSEEMSLTDVAYNVGFEDQSYYTKVFKKATGISPGQYKMKKGMMR